MRAAHQRTQPRGQLMQVNGFDDVVIGPGIQPLDAGAHGIAGRQHQNGGGDLACAHQLQHLHAVLAGQAQVEHGSQVAAGLQLAGGGVAVAHPVHLKALLAQSGPQPRAQQIIVFSQQHAHVQVPARAGRAQSGCKRDKGSGSGLVLA